MRVTRVHQLYEREEGELIEGVVNNEGSAAIRVSAMHQQQPPQEPEFYFPGRKKRRRMSNDRQHTEKHTLSPGK